MQGKTDPILGKEKPLFRYQRNYEQGSNVGFLTTNRIFRDGGYGHTIGVDGLLRFKKSYTVSFEYNRSIILEPQADWIEENDRIGDFSTNLDGEQLNGNALNVSLRRNTKNWNSGIDYQQFSPHYQTPLGFVTQNSIRTLNAYQGYQYFFDKEDFLKQFNIELESELTYNYNNLRKFLSFDASTYVQLDNNIRSQIGYSHIVNEEYEGFNAKSMDVFEMFVGYNPSESIRLGVFTSIGESIRYDDENPAIGDNFFIGTFNSFQITPKLRFSPSIRYSQLKNKEDKSLYFSGFIARSVLNFQFNNDLSFRLVGEFNDFDKNFFYQPLLKWNPNPFTIFYIGGTNGYSQINPNNRYGIENSQLYFKFQYQFDL